MTAGRASRQQIEEAATDVYLEIPDIFGGEEGDFLIQVDGAIGNRAGILKGDYAVVRPSGGPGRDGLALAVTEKLGSIVCQADAVPAGATICGKVIGILRTV